MASSEPKAAQFTIRGVPARVERSLRAKARREGRSLKLVLLGALAREAESEGDEVEYDDLHLLARNAHFDHLPQLARC